MPWSPSLRRGHRTSPGPAPVPWHPSGCRGRSAPRPPRCGLRIANQNLCIQKALAMPIGAAGRRRCIMHVSSHSRFEPDSPLFLAPAGEDGALRLRLLGAMMHCALINAPDRWRCRTAPFELFKSAAVLTAAQQPQAQAITGADQMGD